MYLYAFTLTFHLTLLAFPLLIYWAVVLTEWSWTDLQVIRWENDGKLDGYERRIHSLVSTNTKTFLLESAFATTFPDFFTLFFHFSVDFGMN